MPCLVTSAAGLQPCLVTSAAGRLGFSRLGLVPLGLGFRSAIGPRSIGLPHRPKKIACCCGPKAHSQEPKSPRAQEPKSPRAHEPTSPRAHEPVTRDPRPTTHDPDPDRTGPRACGGDVSPPFFQQVFSHTPTFMVYVMILLANFTVHSMANNFAIAAPIESTSTAITEIFSSLESSEESNQKFDSSALKTFSVSGPGSRTTSIGGNHGGGGKARPAASGTDGDGLVDKSGGLDHKIVPDGTTNQVSPVTAREEESVSGLQERAEELKLWNSIAEEASRMQAEARGDFLDSDTIQQFISPVKVKLESDEDYPEFFKTELVYRMSLAMEPNNSLLLANFAQFLYLIAHDYDRAEEYFKKATEIEPKDAEAYSKYANFLWVAKKDLWAAEETYLEAISADSENTYYAANYAHFLWNSGAEDTCFPLDGPEEEEEERVCDA